MIAFLIYRTLYYHEFRILPHSWSTILIISTYSPCTQCLKKLRPSLCTYAPKLVKKKQPKSMTARLKRLEGMVRDMFDEEGNPRNPCQEQHAGEIGAGEEEEKAENAARGKVVVANGVRGGGTAYVGATHFMAMLDDVSAGPK